MIYRITNLLAFIVMITMNTLANSLPMNGKTTGELSDQYPNLFVPAGITFSIWGVIYLALLLVMIVQFLASYQAEINSLRWTIAANFLLNALWIVVWHYEYVALSLAVMLGLLATLVIINMKLMNSKGWVMRLAFGIYIGWICLATIANTTTLFVTYSWDGFGIGEQTWTIIMILVGAGLGAWIMQPLRNPFLALALLWGFYGIVLKRQADHPAIVMAAYAGMVVIALAALYVIVKPEGLLKSEKSS